MACHLLAPPGPRLKNYYLSHEDDRILRELVFLLVSKHNTTKSIKEVGLVLQNTCVYVAYQILTECPIRHHTKLLHLLCALIIPFQFRIFSSCFDVT
jgi:hypothetical protein